MDTGKSLDVRLLAAGLRREDMEESFARSSGPGGQNVNKVSTACTVRHLPSGVSVTASDSRSQYTNRLLAWRRIIEIFENRRAEARRKRLADAAKSRRQLAVRSRGNKRRLVEGKRRRGETKKLRGRISP